MGMSREILFRGKSELFGWVEGWYVPAVEWRGHQFPVSITHKRPEGWLDDTPVIPETVGQYTGLTDKNGKKVFENDIIVICYETDGEEFTETKRVHYNEKECCWYPMRWEESCEYCDHYTEVKSIEVIGNIHDNPELLED